jgi:hypothetical protein
MSRKRTAKEMRMKRMRTLVWTGPLAGCLLLGLTGTSKGEAFLENAYWNSGKAEFQVYEASVKKYGTDRKATVKLILVKEPFDPLRLVKTRHEDDAVDVIKLNFIREIPTGIYDYFQMASIFFERSSGRILKYAMSSQDGCGTTFVQYLRREEKHVFHYHSYFDDQGDSETVLQGGEFTFYDALPLVLRFRLPRTGEYRMKIVDSLLSNQAVPPAIREGRVRTRSGGSRTVGGKTYPSVFLAEVRRGEQRDLLVFGPEYPHRLLEWRKADGDGLVLNQSHFLYYWRHVQPEDGSLGGVRDKPDPPDTPLQDLR